MTAEGAFSSNRLLASSKRSCTQCFCNSFWVFGGHLQYGTRRPFRNSPALFPILKGRYTNTDHQGKFGLRFLQAQTNSLDVGRSKPEHTTGFHFTAPNSPSLFDTLHQLVEVTLFHLNSSRTRRPSIRNCADVKSSWSLFGYTNNM